MQLPRLYPIIDFEVSLYPLEFLIEEFAAAGLPWVQLRDKQANSRQLFANAQRVVELARSYGVTAIVNDRADIAWLSGADGVHVGQEDLPVEHARKIVGPEKIVGYSTHNLAQALEALQSSADYIAIGPVFATTSKANPDPIVAWEELREIRKRIKKPIVAIGGITSQNAAQLFDIGLDSVAVIRDLVSAPDIRSKISQFLKAAGA
ncbi:MAG: thiamine phosphate synthase [Acidobacteria bacterium]|nr:thiamine phosphate synthase [Acidobacteriota bacterium]